MATKGTVMPKASYSTELVAPTDGAMGGPDLMRHGPSHGATAAGHPLEQTEKVFFKNQLALEEDIVRSAQGEHAVIKMNIERSITSKLQRLGPLQSSLASFEVLMGMDEQLGFDDSLNHYSFAERFQDSTTVRAQRLGKF